MDHFKRVFELRGPQLSPIKRLTNDHPSLTHVCLPSVYQSVYQSVYLPIKNLFQPPCTPPPLVYATDDHTSYHHMSVYLSVYLPIC